MLGYERSKLKAYMSSLESIVLLQGMARDALLSLGTFADESRAYCRFLTIQELQAHWVMALPANDVTFLGLWTYV